MVTMLRVDDRLLHGQVAFSWINQTNPDAILIANDGVVNDEITKLAIKMAKPAGVKMAIKSLKDGIDLINNPKSNNMKLFVVVKNTDDALKVVQEIEGIKMLNIGGASNKKEGGKMILKGIYMTAKDIENIRKLIPLVETIDTRVVPSDSCKNIEEFI